MKLLRSPQILLATLAGLFLVASFIPGFQWLAYIAIAAGAYEAIPSTWHSLRNKSIDVDFLMLLSAAGSTAIGRPTEAAVLMFLFSLSKALEDLTLAKTKAAIEGLIQLRPTSARVVRAGLESVVPLEQVVVGDQIIVPAFEPIPTDGEVMSGEGSIDNSALTGESVPVSFAPGEKVMAGGRNLDFGMVMIATAPSTESTLQKVMDLVQDAQENKASGERISQWFGQRYTLAVLGISLASFLIKLAIHLPISKAIYESLILLVALSPCALVISVPAATLSALAWAAKRGILIRGGEFIERAGQVDAVVLDKTGTLTKGRPELAEICVCASQLVPAGASCSETEVCWSGQLEMSDDAKRFLGLAAVAESQSTHPIASAITAAAKKFGAPVLEGTDFQTIPGHGVRANVNGQTVSIGQLKLFNDSSTPLDPTFLHHVEQIQSQGMTVAIIETREGFAALGFRDQPRAESKQLIQSLRENGVEEVIMYTGDNARTAAPLAHEVGLTSYRADMLPGDKAAAVEELGKSRKVMMVGDGINDAPALAKSFLGVAMGGLGSDIAMNAADVVLMHDRLDMIPALIKLGKKANGIIAFNLILGGAVIGVLTLTALVGILPLPLAVVGHEGSTLVVILNGLRLLRGVEIPNPKAA